MVLQNRKWDNNLYGDNYDYADFKITILDSQIENWDMGDLTNNGFYFDSSKSLGKN